jgi:hypothetical protein
MIMGSTKNFHEIDKGGDDNALTMPTLPELNHKKRTLQLLFSSTMALMTFLQLTTKIFY